MKEDRERESEFERRIREQTAYRDAKREARLLKAGEFEGHPWVKSALESKDRASRPPRPGEDSNTAQHGGRRGRLAKSNLLWACAALLPVLALALLFDRGPAEPAKGPVSILLWHNLTDERELARLKEASASLATGETALHLVGEVDLPSALPIALLSSALPDIAIVDAATAERLREGGRLIQGSDGQTVGHFPLASPLPWTRPMVLVALTKDRTREESDRVLLLSRSLHRLLAAETGPAPQSPP